jgi:acyl carrier protein
MTDLVIKQRLAQLVAEASDGTITESQALTTRLPLTDLGLTSLSRMRLIDAVEDEYGIEIELDDTGWDLVDNLDALTSHLTAR